MIFAWLGRLGILVPLAACAASNNNAVNNDLETPAAEPEEPQGELEGVLSLQWKSAGSEPDRGEISGTLPDGKHLAGLYFEVAPEAEQEFFAPAWEGWQPFWSAWSLDDEEGTKDWPQFLHSFTGTVIANMVSDDGQTRLRCRFIIDTPTTGMEGAESGLCELSDGELIEDVVLAPQ